VLINNAANTDNIIRLFKASSSIPTGRAKKVIENTVARDIFSCQRSIEYEEYSFVLRCVKWYSKVRLQSCRNTGRSFFSGETNTYDHDKKPANPPYYPCCTSNNSSPYIHVVFIL